MLLDNCFVVVFQLCVVAEHVCAPGSTRPSQLDTAGVPVMRGGEIHGDSKTVECNWYCIVQYIQLVDRDFHICLHSHHRGIVPLSQIPIDRHPVRRCTLSSM